MTRLGEYTRDEWRDVCRRLRPDLERDEFDEMWGEFVALKAHCRPGTDAKH